LTSDGRENERERDVRALIRPVEFSTYIPLILTLSLLFYPEGGGRRCLRNIVNDLSRWQSPLEGMLTL
jgi:hypothetical protein